MYDVTLGPIPVVTTGSIEDQPLLILDPRVGLVRRVDFREPIQAITPFEVVKQHLLNSQKRLKRQAHMSLANAIPFKTLYTTYSFLFALLDDIRSNRFTPTFRSLATEEPQATDNDLTHKHIHHAFLTRHYQLASPTSFSDFSDYGEAIPVDLDVFDFGNSTHGE